MTFRHNALLSLVAVLTPIIAVLSFVGYETLAIKTGYQVELVVTGYDPTDFLRGHYIRYDALLDEVQVADPENSPWEDTSLSRLSGEGYLVVNDTNGDGVGDTFGSFYWEKPDEPYLFAEYYYYNNGEFIRETISLKGNQERYYLSESIAYTVERNINSVEEFVIRGSVHKGLFRAIEIEVDGVIY